MVRKVIPPTAFVIQRKTPTVPRPGITVSFKNPTKVAQAIQPKAVFGNAMVRAIPLRANGTPIKHAPRAFVLQASRITAMPVETKEPIAASADAGDEVWETQKSRRKEKGEDLSRTQLKAVAENLLRAIINSDKDKRTFCVIVNSRGNLIASGKSGKSIYSGTVIGAADNPDVKYQKSCAEPHALEGTHGYSKENPAYSLAINSEGALLRACPSCKDLLGKKNVIDLFWFF